MGTGYYHGGRVVVEMVVVVIVIKRNSGNGCWITFQFQGGEGRHGMMH